MTCAFLCLLHVVAITHAERTVDRDDPHASSRSNDTGSIDERIGEGEREEDQHRNSERQQDEITQPAVADRTLHALFEKHKRAEGVWGAPKMLQQVKP